MKVHIWLKLIYNQSMKNFLYSLLILLLFFFSSQSFAQSCVFNCDNNSNNVAKNKNSTSISAKSPKFELDSENGAI